MNKTEVINKVSALSGIDTDQCIKVIDALQSVLTEEIEHSPGKAKALDKVDKLLSYLKRKSNK